MGFRLVGHAAARIDTVLLESALSWGPDAADRYARLIIRAMTLIGDTPGLPGARDIRGVKGVRALHLRHVRRLSTAADRVGDPRHVILYRVAPDGMVEILGLAHDRMRLSRAARQSRAEATEAGVDIAPPSEDR